MLKVLYEENSTLIRAEVRSVDNVFDVAAPLKANECISNATELPLYDKLIGKTPILYYNKQDDVFFYEYKDRELTAEERLINMEVHAADVDYTLMMGGLI